MKGHVCNPGSSTALQEGVYGNTRLYYLYKAKCEWEFWSSISPALPLRPAPEGGRFERQLLQVHLVDGCAYPDRRFEFLRQLAAQH